MISEMKYRNRLLQQQSTVRILYATVVIAILFATATTSLSQTTEEIAENALAATVYLEMQGSNGLTLGIGSGFFVRPDLIATNFHVIQGAVRGTAKLVSKDTKYTIEGITATDVDNDLVLLKVIADGIKPLSLGDSDAVRIGAQVYVVGNPKGMEGTFSDGIISSIRRADVQTRFQMTAPISSGSSGGAVLNRKGEVIGVSVSAHQDLDAQNINFAIPVNKLKELLTRAETAKPLTQGSKPISTKTYFNWGNRKSDLGDYAGAIADYTQAIRLTPDFASAYYNRGIAKAALGHYIAAIADYTETIRLKPDHASAYYNRGIVKRKLKQYDAAIADYTETIRLKSDHASAYYNRGIANSKLGKYFAEIADYDMTIRLKPDHAKAYNNRGIAKANLKQYSAAIADYDIAIQLDPDDASAYYNRGVAKANLEKYKIAMTNFDIAIRLKPDHAKAYHGRGLMKALLGRTSEAKQDYQTALKLAKEVGDKSLIETINQLLKDAN